MRARRAALSGIVFLGWIGWIGGACGQGAALYQPPGAYPGAGYGYPSAYGYPYGYPGGYGYGYPGGGYGGTTGFNPYLTPPPPPTQVDEKQLPQGPKATVFPSTSGGVIDASPSTIPEEHTYAHTPGYARSLSVEDVADPSSAFYGGTGGNSMKWSAISATARKIGMKAGYAAEAAKLNERTIAYAGLMDAHYNFAALMLMRNHVVPPVIIEAGPSAAAGSDKVLYLTLGQFLIVRDARVTAKIPNWREYILLPATDPHPPGVNLVKTDDEKAMWDRAARFGWDEGVAEARASFSTGLDRLDRDYQGMKTYHRLAADGAVSVLEVNVRGTRAHVMNDGRRALIEPRVVRLVVEPRFKRPDALTPEADRAIEAYQAETGQSVEVARPLNKRAVQKAKHAPAQPKTPPIKAAAVTPESEAKGK